MNSETKKRLIEAVLAEVEGTWSCDTLEKLDDVYESRIPCIIEIIGTNTRRVDYPGEIGIESGRVYVADGQNKPAILQLSPSELDQIVVDPDFEFIVTIETDLVEDIEAQSALDMAMEQAKIAGERQQ